MSLQPSADDAPAVETTRQLRPLIAWALLGVNGLWLLIALQKFLFPGDFAQEEFSGRAFSTFGESTNFGESQTAGLLSIGFAGILQIALPVLAVILLTHVRPAFPNPKIFLFVVLGEFAVSALFGLLSFFVTFSLDVENMGRLFFEMAMFRLGLLALLGVAAFWTFKIAQPHLASRPQYGYGAGQGWGGPQQGGWPQQGGQPQQGGWPQGGQPGAAGPQQGGWPQQGPAGQPVSGQPGQPGQPGQQGGWPQQGGQPPQGMPPQQGGWPQQ